MSDGPIGPRFSVIANHHASTRKDWPWAILDTKTDELCAFASNEETAHTTANGLNRHINHLGPLAEVKRRVQQERL